MLLRIGALALVLVLVGCDGGPSPAEQDTLGETVWSESCRVCHIEGGIGRPLTKSVLRSYETAQSLVEYTSFAMPYGMGGSLTPEEYRAVTAYLLHRHRLLPSDVPLRAGATDTLQVDG